jgi:large subunit ribosomal protein L22
MTDEAKDTQADDAQTEDAQAEEKPKRRPRRTRAKGGGEAAEAKAEAASKRPRRTRAKAKAEEPKDAEPKADATKPEEEEAAETPKPAPRRRGSAEGPATPALVRAQAKYVRTSARKARLVCDHIRGKSVEEARAVLQFAPRAVARDWSKLLESAVANAEHNHELVGDDLRIKDAHADEGPTLKRYRPRAMGRATRIRKRTTHLSITLTPKETV